MAIIVVKDSWNPNFTLSDEALSRLGWTPDKRVVPFGLSERSNPALIRVCKELGPRASAYDREFKLFRIAAEDVPFVSLVINACGIESVIIDCETKQNTIAMRSLDSARSALLCNHMTDSEKISYMAKILKT